MISHFILIPVFRGIRITTLESVRRQIHKTSLCTLNFFVCLFLLLKQKYVGKCHKGEGSLRAACCQDGEDIEKT